ncbi:unnamed protein product [Enterobius vermicularis]|uniref:Uncharacterized protein n=1 Tax=Enterobius vermicularis TaxID=51028 RepID=A0A0N4V6V7_ENTVE|nr:unnamed protein product [Enterobius vermicularis]
MCGGVCLSGKNSFLSRCNGSIIGFPTLAYNSATRREDFSEDNDTTDAKEHGALEFAEMPSNLPNFY